MGRGFSPRLRDELKEILTRWLKKRETDPRSFKDPAVAAFEIASHVEATLQRRERAALLKGFTAGALWSADALTGECDDDLPKAAQEYVDGQ